MAMKPLSILLMLFALAACKATHRKHLVAMPDSLRIERLIAAIEESPRVEDAHIGISGSPSEIYAFYDSLLRIAPDTLWRKLTYSKKPVMRYYAFKALMEKKDPDLQKVITRLEKDKAPVEVVSGCTGLKGSLCFFVAMDCQDTALLRRKFYRPKR